MRMFMYEQNVEINFMCLIIPKFSNDKMWTESKPASNDSQDIVHTFSYVRMSSLLIKSKHTNVTTL